MTRQDVVIVGAGMAGLVCARRLQGAGYQACLVEKSRGLGGRMATRRLEGIPTDHGARYLQPQGSLLTSLTQHWLKQGIITQWRPRVSVLDAAGQLHPGDAAELYYVAPMGMSAIGKALGADLVIHKQQRVTAIAPRSDNIWQITAIAGTDNQTVQHRAKALVLAMPAPQILPLLDPWRSQPAIAALLAQLTTVRYAPCITVIGQYASPQVSARSESMTASFSQSEPWMVQGYHSTPFFWVGLDNSKRTVSRPHVVLQSSAAFAANWLESSDLQSAGEALLSHAGKLIAPWLATPDRWQVHRWRYALVEEPTHQSIPEYTHPLPLMACGDWWGTNNVASAVEAGWAAAHQINQQLENRDLPDPSVLLT